jgi:hypothetical protein
MADVSANARTFSSTVVSAVAWPTTVLVSAVLLRRQLSELPTALHARIKEGAGFKVGVLELPPVPQNAPVSSLGEFPFENIDAGSNWERPKYSRYGETRSIQLVYRLCKSSRDAKSFDIEIFIIPHATASTPEFSGALNNVERIYFYLGCAWGNKLLVVNNCFNGFALAVTSWGATLCVAQIVFTDGGRAILERYLDFEMGDVAPLNKVSA